MSEDFKEPVESELADLKKAKKVRKESALQSPLETYLREINETRLLTADEEKELARAIAKGDAFARDRMVRANLRLVVNIRPRLHQQGPRLAGLDRRRKPWPAACCGRF